LTTPIPPLAPEARRSVLIGTLAITLASVTASEVAMFFISLAFALDAGLPAYAVSGVIPLLVAGPGSYMQLKRLEQVRSAYRELARVSSADWLTGCLNFRAFTERTSIATEIGSPGALLLVDVDDFKTINDQYGHDKGDEVLRRIAALIDAQTGSSDLVGRIGGDKFGIYLRVATDRHAREVGEAIREGIADMAFVPEAVPHPLTASIGIVTATKPIQFRQLLRIGERQLCVAKENGRNRFAITAVDQDSESRAAA
jgi:diguanylate cyclase